MSEERSQFAQRIDERKFSPSRRGYDKREVKDYLEDLEQAFRELEGHNRRTSQRVSELETDLSKARATERVSVDNAMMAVFDAKDRILDRARRRADEIEEEAHSHAGRIREAAITDAGGADGPAAGEIAAARAQADEIVAAARREADRVRNDAQSDVTEDLEAEVTALAAQVRRAHDDTASVKEDLDTARRRIVELESDLGSSPSEDLEQRFAELEAHLSVVRGDAERLEGELAARDEQVEALSAAVAAAEQALDQSKSYVSEAEAALDAKAAEGDGLRRDLESTRNELESLRAAQQEHSGDDDRLAEAAAQLASKSQEIESLTKAVAESEATGGSLHEELASTKARLETAEQESVLHREELEQLRQLQETAAATGDAVSAIEAELDAERAQAAAADFVHRMSAIEATLANSLSTEETSSLIAEIGRIAGLRAGESVEVHSEESPPVDLDEAKAQAEAILASAREEAESIETEAEEQADLRAAKVIARAREEADQVRQTVANLTAQADDARSAALRSKLEAENLAEAQRSIGDAREDIVAEAKNRAEELEREAASAAAAAKEEAAQAVAQAKAEADRVAAESKEQAQLIVANAEKKAEQLIVEAEQAAAAHIEAGSAATDPGDDLAALLAEAEQEVAISEELRRQREELVQREQELAELEQSVAAKQAEAAMLLASARESSAAVSAIAPPAAPPVVAERSTVASPAVSMPSDDSAGAVDSAGDSDSDDPAEKLSALLEQVAPTGTESVSEGDEPVDLDRLSEELDNQPTTRMAWPTPVDPGEPSGRVSDDAESDDPEFDDAEFDEDHEDDLDAGDEPRESRYRSRSARLPRLGNQAKSNMATMANLRKKSRGVND